MLRRCRMAVRLPLLFATLVLLCLGILAPATAAQTEQATPIAGDTSQPGDLSTNSEESPGLNVAAEGDVNITDSSYALYPGYAVQVTIDTDAQISVYQYFFNLPDPLPSWLSISSSASTDAKCGFSEVSNRQLFLTFTGTCQYQFILATSSDAPAGTTIDLELAQTNNTVIDSAELRILTPPVLAFDQTTYTGKVGTPIDGQFTITTPADAPTSTDTALGTPFTSVPISYVSHQGTGNTTCDVTTDTYFIYVSADSNGAGTCTVSFTIGTNSGPTTDPAVTVWANSSGSVNGVITSQIVIEPAILTAEFGSPTYSAKPGSETTATLTMTTDAGISGNAYQVFNPYPSLFEFADPTIAGTSGIDCGTPELTDGMIQGSVTAASVSDVESCTLTFTIRVLINPDTQYAADYEISAFFAGVFPGPSATFSILAPEAATAVFDQPSYSAAPGESATANLTIPVPEVQYGGTVIIQNLAPDVFTFDNTSVSSQTGGVTCNLDVPGLDSHAYVHAIDGPGSCTISFDIVADPQASNGADGDIAVVLLFQNSDPATEVTFTVDDPLTIGEYSFHIQPDTGFAGDLQTAVMGGNPPYTFSPGTEPTQGTLELNEDGTFLYIANRNATGTDSFTYTVTDANGADVTSTAQGQGTVTAIFDPGPPSPTPTATAEVTPTAKPILPGRTPTPTPTATDAGTNGSSSGSGHVTQLPSTGATNEPTASGIGLWMLLLMGAVLLLAATLTRRRNLS